MQRMDPTRPAVDANAINSNIARERGNGNSFNASNSKTFPTMNAADSPEKINTNEVAYDRGYDETEANNADEHTKTKKRHESPAANST